MEKEANPETEVEPERKQEEKTRNRAEENRGIGWKKKLIIVKNIDGCKYRMEAAGIIGN